MSTGIIYIHVLEPLVAWNMTLEYKALLENRVLASIIKDFQHRLLTDVESNTVNIDFIKPILYSKNYKKKSYISSYQHQFC